MSIPAKATIGAVSSPVKASGLFLNDSPSTRVGIVVVVSTATFPAAVGAGPAEVVGGVGATVVDVVLVVVVLVVVVLVVAVVVVVSGANEVGGAVVGGVVVGGVVVGGVVVGGVVVGAVVVGGGDGTEKQAPPALRFSLPPAWLPPVSLA